LFENKLCVIHVFSSGVVVVVDLHIEKRTKPDKLRISTEHKGATVTALFWDERRVFVGDNNGLVTAINAGTKVSISNCSFSFLIDNSY
jgi:hypothetical protein